MAIGTRVVGHSSTAFPLKRAPPPAIPGGDVLCDADRHGAGVSEILSRPTPATAQIEHRSAWTPSDPRRGILPRGGARWIKRGDQISKAPLLPRIRHRPK